MVAVPHIKIADGVKKLTSETYNYEFNMKNGCMAEWGRTMDENPEWSPLGPTILDIEVTSICKGPSDGNGHFIPCPFCYKSNTANGHNMSFETFKTVIDSMPKYDNHHILTQVAFGADAQCESNPEIWKMMEYCRTVGLVPNITVADVTAETATKLATLCGAVACSLYKHANNFETGIQTIETITNQALAVKFGRTVEEFENLCKIHNLDAKKVFYELCMQLNVHFMLSENTANDAMYVLNKLKTDPRLKYVNAIVFLHLKKKGRGSGFNIISSDRYNEIVNYAMDNNISIGFDTCGAGKFKNFLKENKPDQYDTFDSCIESCCAGRLSSYVNEHGEYFPCSFLEKTDGDWNRGISVDKNTNFLQDVWLHEKTRSFGQKATTCGNMCAGCPYWEV